MRSVCEWLFLASSQRMSTGVHAGNTRSVLAIQIRAEHRPRPRKSTPTQRGELERVPSMGMRDSEGFLSGRKIAETSQ